MLQNPTSALFDDYLNGGLGTEEERRRIAAAEAVLSQPPAKGNRAEIAAKATLHELAPVMARRARYARAFSAFYGRSTVPGFDFATPEAALATLESQDLVDELLFWLLELPMAIVADRRASIRKNSRRSSKSAA